jgi:multidrug efflux system membrane fusion protein
MNISLRWIRGLRVVTQIGVGSLAMVGLMIWAAGGCVEKGPEGRQALDEGEPLLPGTPTIQVLATNLSARIPVMGTTASEQTIQISPRLSAEVQTVTARAGDRVKVGDELVRLDDREIREQLAVAESQRALADREFQRAKQLFEKNATTEQSLTAAESAAQTAKANVDRVNVLLSYAHLVSPIEGIVIERRIEVGDMAHPGQVLMTIYDPKRMRIETPVPVRLIDRLALGKTVEVTIDHPSIQCQGHVEEIVGAIDPLSRTRKVKVHLPEQAGILPGTFGRIWVQDLPRPFLLIPPIALQRWGQLEMVEVVRGDRRIRRLVKAGGIYPEGMEILSGLNPGEILVAKP